MIGQTVSHYKIVGELGSGGMGEVFLAEDTSLHRKVALKFLPPNYQMDEVARKRLLREAKSAAGLGHANICTIHEVGEYEGKSFIVMEYVDGQTLRDRLAQGPLPWKEALPIAMEIAEALEEAHENGIVHRDLKPANIMLTPKGHAKVMDFGLAKQLTRSHALPDCDETASQITPQSMPIGTPAYMSPEQLRGEPVTCRSDVFSLGVIFYEMMTGLHPFRAANFPSTADRIFHEEPVAAGTLNPEIPAQIEQLLTRMLAKDPDLRPRSAVEVMAGLRMEPEARLHVFLARMRTVRLFKGRRKGFAVAAAVLLIVLMTAVPTVKEALWDRIGGTNSPAGPILAMLPFESAGVQPEIAELARGLTETVNANLTVITERHDLQVIPASEIRSQHITTMDQARREFGANLVLQGVLHQMENAVRVTFVLVEMPGRRQAGADVVTASMADAFALEDMVTRKVLECLDIVLQPREREILAAREPGNRQSYDFYVRAIPYLKDYQKSESIEKAIALFQRAVQMDRKYSPAHAGLGETFWYRYLLTGNTKWAGEALTACTHSVSLDSRLAAGHTCLGTVYGGSGKYELAAEEFRLSLSLDPTSDDAYRGLAAAYESLGDTAAAEDAYHRAIQLRPRYWAGYSWAGCFYWLQGRYRDAVEMFVQVTRLAPDSPIGYSNLGGIYTCLGRYDDAIPMFRRSIRINPTGTAYSNLSTIYFLQRKYEEAVRGYERAAGLEPHNWMLWGNLADAYSMVPDRRGQADGIYAKALSLGQQALRVNARDANLLGYMAYYHARRHQRAQAKDCALQALAVASTKPEILFNLALAYANLGESDQAVAWLRKALSAGYSKAIIRDTPLLDGLRIRAEYGMLFPNP